MMAGMPAPALPGKEDHWIEELVGALTDPLIVYPSPWMDSIPEEQKKRLPLERLAHLMRCNQGKAERDEATDLEAMLYMYPRTLEAPLSEQWVRIYLYLGTQVLQMPEDIQQKALTDYDMGHLRDLKRWIYQKRVEARKKKARGEKLGPALPGPAPAPQTAPELVQAKFF